MRFRLGVVGLPVGVIVVFAIQFCDDVARPLNIEHLVDPMAESHIALLSDMLSQKRWLLPIVDDTGDVVNVKFIRQSRVLMDGFAAARRALPPRSGSTVHDWERCQLIYDQLCQPGHMFA